MQTSFTQLIHDLRDHLRREFHLGYYLTVAAILGLALWFNYSYWGDAPFERWMVRRFYGQEWLMLLYLPFYAVPYYLTTLAYAYFHDRWDIFRQREFWLRSLFLLAVLSFDAGFYYLRWLVQEVQDPAAVYVLRRWLANLNSIFAMAIPLWLFWRWRDREMGHFYGLTLRGTDLRPYLLLLLLMVPVVLGASFTEDFQTYYPLLKPERAARWLALPAWASMAIYEVVYALDFVWTELIFRGFMIIGMAEVMGAGAVLPMASVYCFRHFAKPWGESVSSIFGGYILGVIALRQRHIAGGVLIHMGIALLMELFALLHRLG